MNKTNDYSPYIGNNVYLILKKLLKDFGRDDLNKTLKIFSSGEDPLIVTLKLFIFKNLNMHNVKRSVLKDSKKRLFCKIYFMKYVNLPKYIFYFSIFLSSYFISLFIKLKDFIKFFSIGIFLKISNKLKLSNFILKEKDFFQNMIFLKELKILMSFYYLADFKKKI